MRKQTIVTALIVFAALFVSAVAQAAPPFCLRGASAQPQCIYYSANACREKAANIVRANCILNESVIDIPEGPGLWCLVTSTRHVQCYYDNFESCNSQTRSKNALCVRSLKRPPPSKEFESEVENLF